MPDVLRTPSGMIELAPQPCSSTTSIGWRRATAELADRELVLVGRRHLRSNNSWMHNINVLVKGKPRCTLQVHPDDAGVARSAATAGRPGSRPGSGRVRGSGRGHRQLAARAWSACPTDGATIVPGAKMRVAAEHAGVNSNVLTDDAAMDPLSGTAVLNGIPVEVVPAS